jgi:hypothetical protein
VLYIPLIVNFGFSEYAAGGNVVIGFSRGKTDQLRIISEPVIGVQDVSLLESISRSSPSIIESEVFSSGRCCTALLLFARSDRRRSCFSTAVKILVPHASKLHKSTINILAEPNNLDILTHIENGSLSG